MKTQNTSHTPGPWKVETRISGHRYNGQGVRYYSVSHTSEVRDCYICLELAPVTLITSAGDTPNSEGEANACLIAAAPELLEALTSLANYFEVHTMDTGRTARGEQVWREALAAIAKAEGSK